MSEYANRKLCVLVGLSCLAQVDVVNAAPASVDWRTVVTPVKNQSSCDAGYAFAAIAAFESALMIKKLGSYDLSEQQVVDCTFHKYQQNLNFGCGGGDPAIALAHILLNGSVTEANYPYVSGSTQQPGSCRVLKGPIKHNSLKMYQVNARDEKALAEAVASYGPVMVSLNAESGDFKTYNGGVYNNPACSTKVNHFVLLVGYGFENGMAYWILKNSWGTGWGDKGFMKLARGFNRCGIVSQASFFAY